MSRANQILAGQYKNFALHHIKDCVFLQSISTSSSNVVQTVKCSLEDKLVVVKIRFFKVEELEAIKKRQDFLEAFNKQLAHDTSFSFPNILPFSKIIIQEPELVGQRAQARLYRMFLVRPFISTSLLSVLKKPFAITPTERLWIAYQVAKTCSSFHSLSPISSKFSCFCHGHLRPENILLTSFYWAIISDWGSKPAHITGPDVHFQRFFDTGQGAYLAPERLLLTDDLVPAQQLLAPSSDVFSFGLVLIDLFYVSSSMNYSPLIVLKDLKNYKEVEGNVKENARNRLQNIEILDEILVNLIVDCLSFDPSKRPTFSTLIDCFDRTFPYLQNFYTKFSQTIRSPHQSLVLAILDIFQSNSWKNSLDQSILIVSSSLSLITSSFSITVDQRIELLNILIEILNTHQLPFSLKFCRIISELINTQNSSIIGNCVDFSLLKCRSAIFKVIDCIFLNLSTLTDVDQSVFYAILSRYLIPNLVNLSSFFKESDSNQTVNQTVTMDSLIYPFQSLLIVLDKINLFMDQNLSSNIEISEPIKNDLNAVRGLIFDMVRKILNFSRIKVTPNFDFFLQFILQSNSLKILTKFLFSMSSTFDPSEYFDLFLTACSTFEKTDLFSQYTRSLVISSLFLVYQSIFSIFPLNFDLLKLIINTLSLFINDYESIVAVSAITSYFELLKFLSSFQNFNENFKPEVVKIFLPLCVAKILPLIFHPNPLIKKSSIELSSLIVDLIGPVDSFALIAPHLAPFSTCSVIQINRKVLQSITNHSSVSISFFQAAFELISSRNQTHIEDLDQNFTRFYLENIDLFSECMNGQNFDSKISTNYYYKAAQILSFLTPHLISLVDTKARINQNRAHSTNHDKSIQSINQLSTMSYSKLTPTVKINNLSESPFDSLPGIFDLTPTELSHQSFSVTSTSSIAVNQSLSNSEPLPSILNYLACILESSQSILKIFSLNFGFLTVSTSGLIKYFKITSDSHSLSPSFSSQFSLALDLGALHDCILLSSLPLRIAISTSSSAVYLVNISESGTLSGLKRLGIDGKVLRKFKANGLVVCDLFSVSIIDYSYSFKPFVIKTPPFLGIVQNSVIDDVSFRWILILTAANVACLYDLKFPNGLLIACWRVLNGSLDKLSSFRPSLGFSQFSLTQNCSDRLVSAVFNNSSFVVISVDDGRVVFALSLDSSMDVLPQTSPVNLSTLNSNLESSFDLFSLKFDQSLTTSTLACLVSTYYSHSQDKFVSIHSDGSVLEWQMNFENKLSLLPIKNLINSSFFNGIHKISKGVHRFFLSNSPIFNLDSDVIVDSIVLHNSKKPGLILVSKSGKLSIYS
ncbi:hypothetical protein RCL1_004994 [Eukaryota sp. TZLM3-RCL]